MSAEEQSDESKHEQKKAWHVSDSFCPPPCESTGYARIGYWRTTGFEERSGSMGKGEALVASQQISYPILMGDNEATKPYDIQALPLSYLIDARGRVATVYVG